MKWRKETRYTDGTIETGGLTGIIIEQPEEMIKTIGFLQWINGVEADGRIVKEIAFVPVEVGAEEHV